MSGQALCCPPVEAGDKRREDLRALKHFDVDLDVNILANQNATRFHRLVPRQTEVFAVDRACQRVTDRRGLVEWVCHRSALFALECYRLGRATDREVSGQFDLVAARGSKSRAFEGHLWVIFDVKEVRGSQVIVPIRLACVDAVDVYRRGDLRCGEIVRVEFDVPLERFKFTANLADHHVTNAKTDRRVCCVNLPSHGACPLLKEKNFRVRENGKEALSVEVRHLLSRSGINSKA